MGGYLGNPVFVGRTRELAELTHAPEAATTGRGQPILLAGEPGIGKTRLTEELKRTTEDWYISEHVVPCLRPTIHRRAHSTKPGQPGSEGTLVPFVS